MNRGVDIKKKIGKFFAEKEEATGSKTTKLQREHNFLAYNRIKAGEGYHIDSLFVYLEALNVEPEELFNYLLCKKV